MAFTGGAPKSLQASIEAAGSPVELMRSSPHGRFTFPGIQAEFTNWRDEARSWKENVALLELSYHMSELHLRGADVLEFLSQFAANKFDPFPVRKAKQLVMVGHDGNMITDGIVFHEEDDFFRIVGAPMPVSWLMFNAENTSLDVKAHKDDSWAVHQKPRDVFRVQIQGPNAQRLVTELVGGTLPDIKFFSIADVEIAGKNVRALRHGMAGTPGFELYGAWDDQEVVRAEIDRVGAGYGLTKIGATAYAIATVESGWLPMPLPAIYTSPEMRPYREWLNSYYLETIGSLGGSMVAENIEDYYVDPIELGYGSLIDWDRDFLGRDALKERAANQRRKKVTLVWNDDDVAEAIRSSLFDSQDPAGFIALPTPGYVTWPAEAVVNNGQTVGFSQVAQYSPNARHILSMAVVDIDLAEPGTELTLLWGDPESRASIGEHEIRELRVTVAAAPYFEKENKTHA